MGIFRSAVTDEHDEVDIGYLALFWGLIGWSGALVTVLFVGTVTAFRFPDKGAEIITSVGVAIGAVSGGFATMLGAVGLFRMGDKQHPAPGTTTTTKSKEETKVEVGAAEKSNGR